jgi:hypothetical protein
MSRLPPVEHRIVVRLAPADAFDLFTRGMARWWPFKAHSCSGEGARDVQFEPCLGGTVTEVAADGTRHPWGVLTAWEPPRALAMTWHPAQAPEAATQLALRFTAVAGGCEVHLVHGGWDARSDAAAVRGNYDEGWALVLGLYAAAAAGEMP